MTKRIEGIEHGLPAADIVRWWIGVWGRQPVSVAELATQLHVAGMCRGWGLHPLRIRLGMWLGKASRIECLETYDGVRVVAAKPGVYRLVNVASAMRTEGDAGELQGLVADLGAICTRGAGGWARDANNAAMATLIVRAAIAALR